MYIKKQITPNLHSLSIHHNHPLIVPSMYTRITSWFPSFPREYVIACIGTDRSTGDSLGPLVGTYLSEIKPKHMTVYGTLHEPVHGKNLETYIEKINSYHRNPFVIAIDACLGKRTSIGNLISIKEPLKPGAALNKDLPMIGDVNVTGVVNISGCMEYTVLQNTRLSLVVDMAKQITNILSKIDEQLTFRRPQPATFSPCIEQTVGFSDHTKETTFSKRG